MSEINYSKKQINPLVEKYQINVETNKLFNAIITMFNGQTNYQIWAIKLIFEQNIDIFALQRIKQWSENNQNEIKNLLKGNIILYKKKNDIQQLFDEMDGLDKIKFVKDSINKFNTRQRKMLSVIIDGVNNGLDALSNRLFNEWYDIFRKMSTMVGHRQEKLISTSSAIDDFDFLKQHITSAFAESYEWNKEDMLGFMARNASDCEVVHNEGDIVVVKVPSFKSSKLLCGNGRTGWCLTRQESYFKQYVTEAKRNQFFFFDFSKKENHELAHIGFTVSSKDGITNAHSTKNSNMCGNGISIDGKIININTALEMAKVPSSAYIKLNSLVNYKWDVEMFLKYIESEPNKNKCSISYFQDNRLIISISDIYFLKNLIAHTFIDSRRLSDLNNSKCFLLFDFNLKKDDDKSLILIKFEKDKYNFDMLTNMLTAYNNNIKDRNYLDEIGINISSFLQREKIDATILLHKLIDEKSEKEAIRLIQEEGDKFNVNFEFNRTVPMFKAIDNHMFDLFFSIINHKSFNSNTCDEYGEPLLQFLMYNLFNDGSEHDKELKELIKIVLKSDNFDFNSQNINLETPLIVACTEASTSWVVKELLKKPNININIVDDFNSSALTVALNNGNIEAVKLLCKREDLVIREEDFEIAKKVGINLKDIMNETKFSYTIENASSSSEESFTERFAKILSLKK